MFKICVIGLGYVGLPTASLLANRGFDVCGVDIDAPIVHTLNRGEVYIQEPDLDILVRSGVNSGNLKGSLFPEPADIFILAVPTPVKEKHKPDISYLEAATEAIAPYLKSENLIIIESTSPAGTTEKITDLINKLRPELDPIYVAYCPERVLPGRILEELIGNDRIVGGINPVSTQKAIAFYQTFVKGEIFGTNARTAELVKLSENAFRDVNIAFANELSLICEELKVNVWELLELANRHPRVNILKPGPGVGGHCIAIDPWFIVDSTPQHAQLIRTAREVNDSKPAYVVDKVKKAAKSIEMPIITCLGLAYKPNIGDLRESPAIEIVQELAKQQLGKIIVVEPYIKSLPPSLDNLINLEFINLEIAIEKADIIVLLVAHHDFIHLDYKVLSNKIIIDMQGIWQKILTFNN